MRAIITALFLILFSQISYANDKIILDEFLCNTTSEGTAYNDGGKDGKFRWDDIPIKSAKVTIYHKEEFDNYVFVEFNSPYPDKIQEERKNQKFKYFDFDKVNFQINFDFLYMSKNDFIESERTDFTAKFGEKIVIYNKFGSINISRLEDERVDFLFMKCAKF